MAEENNPANVPPPAPLPTPPSGDQSNIPPPPPSVPVPPPVSSVPPPPPAPPIPPPPPMPNPVPPPPPMPTPSPMRPPVPPPVAGGVQPPPPPEIGIRTMESDLKSMQSSGGSGASPQTFKPEDLFSKPMGGAVTQIPPMTPGSNPAPAAPSPMGMPTVKVIGPQKSNNKKIMILAGVLAVLIVVGLIVFLVVLPGMNSTPKTAPPVAVTPAPMVATTTPTPQPPPPFVHASFFTSAVSPSTTVWLTSPVTLASLQAAIASSTNPVEPPTTFEGLAFANTPTSSSSSSTPVSAQSLLSWFASSASSTFLTSTFNQDVTGFAYYNKNGVWPGYVFELNSGVNLASATSTLDPIIESDAVNFFQVPPGTPAGTPPGTFIDGALPDKTPVRYLSFGTKGAALEYGWFKGFLVISTSYQGLIDAEQRL